MCYSASYFNVGHAAPRPPAAYCIDVLSIRGVSVCVCDPCLNTLNGHQRTGDDVSVAILHAVLVLFG